MGPSNGTFFYYFILSSIRYYYQITGFHESLNQTWKKKETARAITVPDPHKMIYIYTIREAFKLGNCSNEYLDLLLFFILIKLVIVFLTAPLSARLFSCFFEWWWRRLSGHLHQEMNRRHGISHFYFVSSIYGIRHLTTIQKKKR